MKTLKIHLLQDNMIFVGEVGKEQDLRHSFFVSEGISDLARFLESTKTQEEDFNQAFGYWIICALGRCKEDINKYGILTRKLVEFSKKLWKRIRSLARKIAIRIKLYQERN